MHRNNTFDNGVGLCTDARVGGVGASLLPFSFNLSRRARAECARVRLACVMFPGPWRIERPEEYFILGVILIYNKYNLKKTKPSAS